MALPHSVGPKHCFTLACQVGLSSDLAAIGDVTAAAEYGESTFADLRDVLGASHPITLACAMNLAADLASIGRRDQAENLRSETAERFSETLSAEHPTVLAAAAGQRLDCDFDTSPT